MNEPPIDRLATLLAEGRVSRRRALGVALAGVAGLADSLYGVEREGDARGRRRRRCRSRRQPQSCPSLKGCERADDTDIGPIPGGPIPMCWIWHKFQCLPCNGEDVDDYSDICNETYSRCEDLCTAGS